MSPRVAVVTGANKGIGLEIVRVLCRHFGQDGVVYLTARNEGRGLAAVELLQKEGLDPKFHLLDVTDQSTIDKLRTHLEIEHGGIDILINNAGILPLDVPLHEKAVLTLGVNFFGLRAVCQSLIPLVRSGGRIVNVASWSGYQIFKEDLSDELRDKFRRVEHDEDVVYLMNEFINVCKSKTIEGSGWTDDPYGVSKLGVILLSMKQADMISRDKSREDILVNACCPGFVDTDMSAYIQGTVRGVSKMTTVKGADTPVFLALLPSGKKEPNGQFVMRRKAYDFVNNDVIIPLSATTE